MFKKATSRQLLSVSGLFILVWQIALGQEQWKGNTYLPEQLPVREIKKSKDTGILGTKDEEQALIYHPLSGVLSTPDERSIIIPDPWSDETQSWPLSFQSFASPSEKSFSSLVAVENLLQAPWRMQVKLFITAANDQRYTCSGTLIDASHVITASHCIFSIQKGGWAKEVEVAAAYAEGEAPYGAALMKEALVWEEWIKRQSYKNDMAIIQLDRPLGAIAGWLAYGYREEDNFFKEENFYNPGYPASGPYDGQKLYNWKGQFDYVYGKELLYHTNLAYAGQSGSGTFFWKDGRVPVLQSVLSHGTPAPNPFTGHVRMTAGKFADIQSFIENSRNPDLDLRPLFVQTDQLIFQGDQAFDGCSFVLFNDSKKAFQEPLEITLELFDKSGQAFELGRQSIELPILAGGRSREIKLQNLNWAWPAEILPGEYSLSVRLILEDANIANNITGLSDRAGIKLEKKQQLPFLDLSIKELNVTAEGNEKTISLFTNHDQSWEIHSLVNWVTVEPSKGIGSRDFLVKVAPYFGMDQRETQLLVAAGPIERVITVIQSSEMETDEVVLTPGWNLISLDVIPADSRIMEVVKGLKRGNLIQITGQEEGDYKVHRPSYSEAQNTLKRFRPGDGYWVQVQEEDVLIVRGKPISEDLKVTLTTGRNLIGYIPDNPQKPQEFFKGWINEGRLKYVIGYKNGKSLRFTPSNQEGSTLKWLENGMGYWVEIAPETMSFSSAPVIPTPDRISTRVYPVTIHEWPFQYKIQHLTFHKSFLINIPKGVEGTLLLMISDTSGRLLKMEKRPLVKNGAQQFSVSYEGIPSRQLVLSMILNDQHINSRVYLND